MNVQQFVTTRQFWAGVAVTLAAFFLMGIGVPDLMRSRLFPGRGQMKFAAMTASSGASGGGEGDMEDDKAAAYLSANGTDEERKMVRTASMSLVVKSPKDVSEKIRLLTEKAGGFLVSSEVNGEGASSATLTVRVPLDKFEQVRSQIAGLAIRVDDEKLEAQDVTKQYVDLASRLRNLRAQETQYLGILKQARTVKDTVDVSEKLNDVRAQIEQQQAEFDALSKEVETVALTISLSAEAEVQVFGLHWRPLYQLKVAARDGIDGIGDYAAAMASVVFYLPAILLWLATLLIGAGVAWRILRWAGKTWFARRAKTA